MKRKITPVDVRIVSSVMRRFLTVIVSMLVFAITAHAYLTRGSDLSHVEFSIGVTTAERFHEPLRELVALSTSRRVGVVVGEDKWDATCELYVLPLADFLRLRGSMKLRGLFALAAAPNDRAVVIGLGATPPDPNLLRVDDIVFGGPTDPNGCWAQLMALSRAGVAVPDGVDGLSFASPGGDGIRVVYSVVDGVHRFGACRASDVSGLIDAGRLQPGEVAVVLDTPALPEFVVATSERRATYFAHELGGLGAEIDEPGLSGRRDTVELLRERGIGSFRPINRSQMAELDAVDEFISTGAKGSDAKWDD